MSTEHGFIEESRAISIEGDYDVIVVGGGVAGTAAALASVRNGCSTLLVEKSVMLGGLATLGSIAKYLPLCDGRGTKVVGGIAEELLRLSIRYGYDNLPPEWAGGPAFADTDQRYQTVFSPPAFVLALDEVMLREGVNLLFDSLFCTPLTADRTCRAIVVENKSGRRAYTAKCFVDATGDADLAFRAGCDCVESDNWLSYWLYSTNLTSMGEALRTRRIERAIHLDEFGADYSGRGAPERTRKYGGTDAAEVTEFLLEGRRLAREKLGSVERGTHSYLSLPGMAQLRTTRRINGRYTLNGNDVSRPFVDSIGCTGDWRKRGLIYEIPYRCLTTESMDNIVAAGRCISASGEAWEVCRVIPPAAMTGQAAGSAAALAVHDNCSVQSLDVAKLQKLLAESGVLVQVPECGGPPNSFTSHPD
jgi:hypothetical protein